MQGQKRCVGLRQHWGLGMTQACLDSEEAFSFEGDFQNLLLPWGDTCLDNVRDCPNVNRQRANAGLAGGQTCPVAEPVQWLCQ